MMSERTKTILLIIGVILACILLIQAIGLGFNKPIIEGSLQVDFPNVMIEEFTEIKRITTSFAAMLF